MRASAGNTRYSLNASLWIPPANLSAALIRFIYPKAVNVGSSLTPCIFPLFSSIHHSSQWGFSLRLKRHFLNYQVKSTGWTWVHGKPPQLASPKLIISIGFSSSHGCFRMVRFVDRVAGLLLTFDYQSGPEWEERHVMIARCVSPRNSTLFFFVIFSWLLNAVDTSEFAKAYPDTVDATFKNHW